MGQRLPQANLNRYTDSKLIARAQQVHDLMLANVATFPALELPIAMVDLQTQIDTYTAASAAAVKGSKIQTNAKNDAKIQLRLSLKSLALYVTKKAQVTGTSFPFANTTIEGVINLSGFGVSKNPTTPVYPITGIPTPIIRRAVSEDAGSLKILVRQYTKANRNTLTYQVNYRTSAIPGTPGTPAGPWQTQTFTGQNQIVLTGLTSGISYDWQIAAVGGRDIKRNENPPVNFTTISSVVII